MPTKIATESNALNGSLNAIYSALSDPTRRAMLARLAQSEASVNELAAPFNMSLPAISKHLKVLENAGLLTKTINAQQRVCKIEGEQLKQAIIWIERLIETDTTNFVAQKAINTPTTAENSTKNDIKLPAKIKKTGKTAKQPKKINSPQEKTDDNVSINSQDDKHQQQIGFDF